MSSRIFVQIVSKKVEEKKDILKIINLYLPFCQQGWSQYFPRPPPRCPMCQIPDDSIRKLKANPCPFIQILSWFYHDFIQILSR